MYGAPYTRSRQLHASVNKDGPLHLLVFTGRTQSSLYPNRVVPACCLVTSTLKD